MDNAGIEKMRAFPSAGRRGRQCVRSSRAVSVWAVCCPVSAAHAQAPEAACALPDGSQFIFWEKPLSFTRTCYVGGDSSRSDDRGPGAHRAAGSYHRQSSPEVLQAGGRVVIAAGTYRECIRPARGGTGRRKMISYEAAPARWSS